MKVILQKFGGTSLKCDDRRKMAAEKVLDAKCKGFNPVVVVSAMGRLGDPYATDTLLSLVNRSNLDKRELDLLISCGEVISAAVMAETLTKLGLKVKVLTGLHAGINTDSNFGNADIIKVNPKRIIKLLKEGFIPIVTGFQGVNELNDVTTLGRGGSDLTATILGEALKAEFVEIYTDVNGIMTADPKVVKEAKTIDSISYNEVFQLSDQGAKVIHPRAVESAMRSNIPILIKNTFTDSKGTVISSRDEAKRIITGITSVPERVQISIETDNSNMIFELLAKEKISVDLINIFPSKCIFTVETKDFIKVKDILDNVNLSYVAAEKCSKISIIGNRMRGIPGIMSKILKVLKDEDIKVLQTADSHTTIWCLVMEKDMEKAVNALHHAFEL